MAMVSLVGESIAGGVITGPGAVTYRVEGLSISLVGDGVAGHGTGAHAGPIMVTGSPWARIRGIPIVRQGSLASCTHDANGNPWMNIP
jgi:uncharacterized Zn-binding protein involved in type VI secretion